MSRISSIDAHHLVDFINLLIKKYIYPVFTTRGLFSQCDSAKDKTVAEGELINVNK